LQLLDIVGFGEKLENQKECAKQVNVINDTSTRTTVIIQPTTTVACSIILRKNGE
jgi:hypothetical protein